MDAKEQLVERERAHIKSLYKSLLREIEDIKESFDERFRLLQDQLPSEYLPLLYVANPMTDDKFMRIRKKILDCSNDILRALELETHNFSVSFVFPENN